MGKVLKADASADLAYTQLNFSAQDVVWVNFDLAFDADALAYFVANLSNDFAGILEAPGQITADVRIEIASGNWLFFGPDSPTPTPEAATWYRLEMGYDDSTGTSWLYIDGALVLTETNPFLVGMQMDGVAVGQSAGSEHDPAVVVYIKNVTAGTSRGATDLLASDGFAGEDFSAWSSTFGDVSIVDDPFAEPTFDLGAVFSVAFDDATLEADPTWTQVG